MKRYGHGAVDIGKIEETIGYTFSDKALLLRCFTHSSAAEENNERLEFLGDAVLEFCISERLYRETGDDEGTMTDKRQNLVSDGNLRAAVKGAGLDKYLVYEGRECNLGAKPIASLFEAILAGVYLDGGMDEAKKFVARFLPTGTDAANYKGLLQELAQSRGEKPPRPTTVRAGGTDNEPLFRSQFTLFGQTAQACGKNKKEAEQRAAEILYKTLTEEKKSES